MVRLPQRRCPGSQAGLLRQQGAWPLLTVDVSRLAVIVVLPLLPPFPAAVARDVSQVATVVALDFWTLPPAVTAASLVVVDIVDLRPASLKLKVHRIDAFSDPDHLAEVGGDAQLCDFPLQLWFQASEVFVATSGSNMSSSSELMVRKRDV